MPQLVPFYFINQISFAFILLAVIVFIFSQNTLPRFVRLFTSRTFISKSFRGGQNVMLPSAKDLLDNPLDVAKLFEFDRFKTSNLGPKPHSKSIFLFDSNYAHELGERLSKLSSAGNKLMAMMGKEQLVMCQKLLIFICNELCLHHPEMFEFVYVGKQKYILNKISGYSYSIINDNPLLIIASLIIEDVNIVVPIEREFYLVSTLTINPVGWNPSERLGFTMSKIHGEIEG